MRQQDVSAGRLPQGNQCVAVSLTGQQTARKKTDAPDDIVVDEHCDDGRNVDGEQAVAQ